MSAEDLLTRLRKAIRQPHEAIHRLNISRIALCLPPNAESSSVYALGLTYYAELYYGLEKAWVSFIGDPAEWLFDQSDNSIYRLPTSGKEGLRALLRLIYFPELLRTRRLEADLQLLRSMNIDFATSLHEDNIGSQTRDYIFQRIASKPHLIVSYSWIMFSAILYGGREIAARLSTAGPEFWGMSATELNSGKLPCPLSFWHVDNEATIKIKFRACIAEADRFLTAQEQQEVLDETTEIFNMFGIITSCLDQEAPLMQSGKSSIS